MKRNRRWSDRDHHFGPFTYSRQDSYRPWGASIRSSGGTHIMAHAFGVDLICELPNFLQAQPRWVDTSMYEWASGPGYTDYDDVEYGVTLVERAVHVRFGRQTHDSSTDKSKCFFPPWWTSHAVREQYIDADGVISADVAKLPWHERHEVQNAVKRQTFSVRDYDGEVVTVSAYIHETDYRRGEGRWKWIGRLFPVDRRRYVDLDFSSEVGPSKGSWKGGMTGCATSIEPGETMEQAVRRFCGKERRDREGRYKLEFLA